MHRVPITCFVALLFVPNGAWAQGEPQGPEFRVNTIVDYGQSNPSVASDSSGNFVVVWQTGYIPLHHRAIVGQRYASTGAPLGGEFGVDSSGSDSTTPSVASDSAGNFVVVWSDYYPGISPIVGQRFASNGAPLGSAFGVNMYFTTLCFSPAVASDSSGNFVVVWSGAPYLQPSDSFGRRFGSDGAPLGPEFRVNTYTTNSQGATAVASDSSGNFVVVWSGSGQSDLDGVFGQRYASTGESLGPEFRVNTYTTNTQGSPAVASDSSGNFVIVWQSYTQDGWSAGIFGQRYASTGAPLGPEFRVNTYTTNSQRTPAVASDGGGSSGDFVVVWQSLAQDGSDFGVFGQRYSQIVPVELMHFRVE